MEEGMTYLDLMNSLQHPDPENRLRFYWENFVESGTSLTNRTVEDRDRTGYEGYNSSSTDSGSSSEILVRDGLETDQIPMSTEDEVEGPDHFSYMLDPIGDSSSDDEECNVEPEKACGPNDLIEVQCVGSEEDYDSTILYKKRIRHKRGVVLPSTREPIGMGPIEVALRSSSERKSKFIFQPRIGLTFDSAAEAYEFYNLYSWEQGFGIKDTGRCKSYNVQIRAMTKGVFTGPKGVAAKL